MPFFWQRSRNKARVLTAPPPPLSAEDQPISARYARVLCQWLENRLDRLEQQMSDTALSTQQQLDAAADRINTLDTKVKANDAAMKNVVAEWKAFTSTPITATPETLPDLSKLNAAILALDNDVTDAQTDIANAGPSTPALPTTPNSP